LDIVLAIISILPPIYTILRSDYLLRREPYFTSPIYTIELVLGTLLIILVIEASRRAVNSVFAGLAVVFLLYLFVGPYLPGILHHRGLTIREVIEANYLFSGEGINGSLMGLSSTILIMFVLFGAFVQAMGVGDFFMNLSTAVAGRATGGPAKLAAVSSALFGTMSGSAVANVYTTGSFTIPLMKKVGYKPQFAGAVEAVASTGGQYMPPIMGITAWVIAENLNIPYLSVAFKSFVPAILFYVALYFMIHFHSLKHGITGEGVRNLPNWKGILLRSYLFLPVVVLFVLLSIGHSPMYSVFYAIIMMAGLGYLKKETRLGPVRLMNTLAKGVKSMLMLVAAIGGVSIIVMGITYSGFGPAIAGSVMSISKGNLFLGLIMIAVASIILGTGIPTVASYVIVAAIGVPALLKLGADPFAAHLFVFYFAVISNVTPPVAMAAYAGASVAGSKPMRTGVEAFVVAIAGYLVPFMFVFYPVVLHGGPLIQLTEAIITAVLGVISLAAGVQGFFFRKINVVMRLLLLLAGILLIDPGRVTNVAGIVLMLSISFFTWFRRGVPSKLDVSK
jgi:TRAP transporter 4TM/12TM fusion protein